MQGDCVRTLVVKGGSACYLPDMPFMILFKTCSSSISAPELNTEGFESWDRAITEYPIYMREATHLRSNRLRKHL
eukprot:snap_masked-scaffold_11-processed-gene-1.24-mRNA-1 protein AED:1.00 eAED:1.00 QI:0/0/0/0/1/1/2/0/74